MKILDSSFIISYFIDSDSNHEKAISLFDEIEEYLILETVLAEVYTVINIKIGYTTAIEVLEQILSYENFTLSRHSDTELKKAIELLSKKKNTLSFIDAILITVSKERKMKLVSFDREIDKYSIQ